MRLLSTLWIAILSFVLLVIRPTHAHAKKIPRYGIFEATFTQAGTYKNPYLSLDHTMATFIGPDGTRKHLPLFWDGGKTWKVRFSPASTGEWKWTVHSRDRGLNGKSGQFQVVASDRRGGIQPMAHYPHHFQRQDGTPFWWMGDTNWALFTSNVRERFNRAAVEHYIDARARQGFNVVHAMLISEAGWGNGGGQPFENVNSQHINPAYWQKVDRRLAYANRKGITVGLVLAWGNKGHDYHPTNWQTFASQTARERYARYVAARYSAYNVYFIVSGEWNSRGSSPKIRKIFTDIGHTIATSDPHDRMIAIHPWGNDSVMSFAGEPWMDFGDYEQMYRKLHQHILDAYKHKPAKPVVNAEYAYYLRDKDGDGTVDKPHSASLRAIRYATWDIVMGGGYFVTGFGTTYFGGNRDPGPFDVDAGKNDPWEQDVQHVKTLFTSLHWWKLKPADRLIGSNKNSGTQWVLAKKDRQYVLYTRGTAHQITLSLGDSTSGKYTLRQFNPRTGNFKGLKSYRGNSKITYTPPDNHDWVLVATADQGAARSGAR